MYKIRTRLTSDAKAMMILILLKSPTLPDQINPSGPGHRITIHRL